MPPRYAALPIHAVTNFGRSSVHKAKAPLCYDYRAPRDPPGNCRGNLTVTKWHAGAVSLRRSYVNLPLHFLGFGLLQHLYDATCFGL